MTATGKAYFANSQDEQSASLDSTTLRICTRSAITHDRTLNRGWRTITVKLVGDRLKKYRIRTRDDIVLNLRILDGHRTGAAARPLRPSGVPAWFR
jgi:hypothetical protein